MRLHITFRKGAEDGTLHSRYYDVDLETYELLKSDFLRFLNESATALRGAAYPYLDVETRQAKELIVCYDDVLYIEAMPLSDPSANKTITTGNLNTGPLRSRISGATSET